MSPRLPLPDKDFLSQLDDSLAKADSLERLVRPLLDLLQAVTGMESTYLTRVDEEANLQELLYVHNASPALTLPEQLVTPWSDTLCRRALVEQIPSTDDVPGLWADNQVAMQLGLASYASAPLRAADGSLLGTLCAASSQKQKLVEGSEHLLAMFAQLISQFIEKEKLIAQLHLAHEALRQSADTDALTGLPNRRALLQELDRRLVHHSQTGTQLVLCFIDLDGFKGINDQYGHVAGDRFLGTIAERLRHGQRPEDYCARLGGDEFVTLTSLRHSNCTGIEDQLRSRLMAATSGCFDLGGGLLIEYPGASVGVTFANGETQASALLSRADAAMYDDKENRRATQHHSLD